MSRRLPFFGSAIALALVAIATSGCVDRRFVVESDPPGALVYMNGKRIGATPLDQQFTYYGKYRFEIVRDGYETVVVDETIRAPWWSWFPLEFVVESLVPWNIHDIRYIPTRPMALPPIQMIPPEEIHARAEQLRMQGHALGGSPQNGVICVPVPGVPPPAVPTGQQ